MPGYSSVLATAKLAWSMPASAASRRASSTDSACVSKPWNREAGKARAMSVVECPWPPPTSATRAPARSLSTTSIPSATHPITVYEASRCGAGARVMKNWLPPVSFPESAIPTTPRP